MQVCNMSRGNDMLSAKQYPKCPRLKETNIFFTIKTAIISTSITKNYVLYKYSAYYSTFMVCTYFSELYSLLPFTSLTFPSFQIFSDLAAYRVAAKFIAIYRSGITEKYV